MFVKLVCLNNIKSMNYLPLLDRWYQRFHMPETFSYFGPWIANYANFRVVPYCPVAPFMPEDGARIGYYNYRLAEITFRKDNLIDNSRGHTAMTYPLEVLEGLMGFTPDNLTPYSASWPGKPGGPNPTAHCYIPARPTEDFTGQDLATDGKTVMRWYMMHKYPEGVSVEEGEKWFLEVHAREVMKQPGLIRFFSARAVDMPDWYMKQVSPNGRQYPFQRVTELWYENFAGWRKSVIDSPPTYTKPAWATSDRYPFFAPYVDLVSTFLLQQPDWTMRDVRPYP
jgi:hypothetical protein